MIYIEVMNRNDKKILDFAKTITAFVVEKFSRSRMFHEMGLYTGRRGKGGDLAKNGDLFVERILKDQMPSLLKNFNFPGATVISEELGITRYKDYKNKYSLVLIIDPVDGSNNLRPQMATFPNVAFSLGIGIRYEMEKQKNFNGVKVAVIADIFNKKVYHAIKNHGAYLNDKKISASIEKNINKSIIGMSFDRTGEKFDEIDKKVKKLLRESYCQRRLGSTSLDLAMVATGQYDAHVSLSGGVKLNDLGAAPLIIEEAGGVVKMNIFNKNGFKITDNFIKYFLDMDKIENKTYRNLRFNIIAANNKIILNKIIKLLPKQEQNNF